MYSSSDFSPWSAYLRQQSNDASLLFNDEGMLSLLVDKHKVDCQILGDSMILSARIGNTPTGTAERHACLCRVLTLTNRHARNRSEFPMLTGQRTLQLRTWMNTNLDYDAFCAQFHRFMEALDAWRDALSPKADSAIRMPTQIDDRPFGRLSPTNSTGIL